MICSIRIIFLVHILVLNFEPCYSACARAEYETNGECCPMCAPGNRVYRDCTEFTSTTCVPCMGATFLDAPNGLKECFNCMICDPGMGLRVKTACTRTSDAVCEPLQGYYCKDENRGSCIRALQHTKCQPGHYIKQIGTADKDAVCAECADGTFSNGTIQICQAHSKCEDMGMREVKPGTAKSDAECGNKTSVGLIVGIVFTVAIIVAAAAVLTFLIVTHRVSFPFSLQFTLPRTAREVSTRPEQETGHEVIALGNPDRSDKPDPENLLSGPHEMSEDDLAGETPR